MRPKIRAELERLSTFLKGLGASSMRKFFNQNVWYDQEDLAKPAEESCFTRACAGGWLDILSGGKVGIIKATKKLKGDNYSTVYHAAMYKKLKNYLGLPNKDIEFIFGTTGYTGDLADVSPLTVAKNIDRVLRETK